MRTSSEFEIAIPFVSASNSFVNSLKLPSSEPSSTLPELSRIDRIACVAHAFVITCFAKKRWSS